MPKHPTVSPAAEAYILQHPNATIDEVAFETGVSPRTISYVRAKLMKKGLIPSSRRGPTPEKIEKPLEKLNITEETLPTIDVKALKDMASSPTFEEEMGSEDEIRAKLLKTVQTLALSPGIHPDTRLSAMQVWVKLKDIARTKDLGPGNPKTEEEAVERLTKLLLAVGPKIALKAFEIVFQKGEASENQQTPAPPSTSETSNPLGPENPTA